MDCPTCGDTLATERGVRQHHTRVHSDPPPNRTRVGCGVGFYDAKARRVYCDDCNPNGGEHNGNYRDATETATCRVCGDEFDYHSSDKDGIYCSTCVEAAEGLLPGNPERGARTDGHACRLGGDGVETLGRNPTSTTSNGSATSIHWRTGTRSTASSPSAGRITAKSRAMISRYPGPKSNSLVVHEPLST